MANKLNSEFNYRYQVIGETPWEKIKTLLGFLEGRKSTALLEEASALRYQARLAELDHLRQSNALPHVLLGKQADLVEYESVRAIEAEGFELNRQEIKILEALLAELYAIVEPTRAKHEDGTPYTDEEMFELNAANEFTATIGKDIYAEIAANGRPSPAKLRNAMSNPYTFAALKKCGLIHAEAQYIEGAVDPLQIDLKQTPHIASVPTHKILRLKE
jgi:hypothetical protein